MRESAASYPHDSHSGDRIGFSGFVARHANYDITAFIHAAFRQTKKLKRKATTNGLGRKLRIPNR